MKRKIVLASTSPRRLEIFKKANLEFEIAAPEYDEEMHLDLAPRELAKYLAQKKAESIASKYPDAIIISGDTLIVHKDKIFGKPQTPPRAKKMLMELNGQRHEVITGFTVLDTKTKRVVTEVDVSRVYLKKIAESEIDAYVATGEPLDKAAAYAIQGGAEKFIDRIEGDVLSIMGLPLDKVLKALSALGVLATHSRNNK